MTLADTMPFTAAEAPITKIMNIDGQQYTWGLAYNELFDFYTFTVTDQDGVILYTTKVVLRDDMLHATESLGIDKVLLPHDFTGEHTRVGQDNFGEIIKIYLLDAE